MQLCSYRQNKPIYYVGSILSAILSSLPLWAYRYASYEIMHTAVYERHTQGHWLCIYTWRSEWCCVTLGWRPCMIIWEVRAFYFWRLVDVKTCNPPSFYSEQSGPCISMAAWQWHARDMCKDLATYAACITTQIPVRQLIFPSAQLAIGVVWKLVYWGMQLWQRWNGSQIAWT